MGLPQPWHVEEMALREWPSMQVQHAKLFLGGMALALGSAASGDSARAETLMRKRDEIELDLETLSRATREHPVDVPGAALSIRLCTMLACTTDSQLAEVLGVPLAIVLAGRLRMGALAERMLLGL